MAQGPTYKSFLTTVIIFVNPFNGQYIVYNILSALSSPVCLLPLLLQLSLGQAATLDQGVKLGLGGGLGFLGDVGQRGDGLEVNSKSGQHGGEVPGLKVQLLTLIGQREDAELAVFKLLPGLDDVG